MSDTFSSQNGTPAGGPAAAEKLRASLLAFRRNMHLLKSSLFHGDLSTAREAFAALRGLGSAPTKRVEMSTTELSVGACAYVALAQALEEGRLQDARRALSRLLGCLHAHPPTKRRHQPSPREDESGRETLLQCLDHGAQRLFS